MTLLPKITTGNKSIINTEGRTNINNKKTKHCLNASDK